MKAIIFAAGQGVRMRPLTETMPKPLIAVAGRPILERLLDILPPEITELILVIGYKGDMIRDRIGESYKGRSVQYVVQEELLGTAHALKLCEPFIGAHEKFLVLNSDDLYQAEDLAALVARPAAILVYEVDDARRFGVVVTDENGRVLDIEEGPLHPKSHTVNTGAYLLHSGIFAFYPERSPRGEFFITDMISNFIRENEMYAVRAGFWIPLGFPEDIPRAEALLREKGLE